MLVAEIAMHVLVSHVLDLDDYCWSFNIRGNQDKVVEQNE